MYIYINIYVYTYTASTSKLPDYKRKFPMEGANAIYRKLKTAKKYTTRNVPDDRPQTNCKVRNKDG